MPRALFSSEKVLIRARNGCILNNDSMVSLLQLSDTQYSGGQYCSGLLKLDTQLSGNLPLERSVHYEEKTHV